MRKSIAVLALLLLGATTASAANTNRFMVIEIRDSAGWHRAVAYVPYLEAKGHTFNQTNVVAISNLVSSAGTVAKKKQRLLAAMNQYLGRHREIPRPDDFPCIPWVNDLDAFLEIRLYFKKDAP